MPLRTTTLSTDPVLVQQHELSVALEPIPASSGQPATAAEKVFSATILTYGATLTHLTCPDRLGQPQDVVLGFDRWQDYLAQAEPGALNPYFGATIGRTASRVGHASFELENKCDEPVNDPPPPRHVLQVSNGVDCHHGGPIGFDKQHWKTVATNPDDPSVTFELISPHGQSGYPGRLVTRVKYMVTGAGELVIEYWAQLEANHAATSDDALDLHSTIVSLTNHAYWNLDGVLNLPGGQEQQDVAMHGQEEEEEPVMVNHCSVRDHTLWLGTSKLIELGNSHPVPTGRILDLKQRCTGTSVDGYEQLLDFTSSTTTTPSTNKRLGPGLDQIPGGFGYDHVYAIDPPEPCLNPQRQTPVSEIGIEGFLPSLARVATLYSTRTGIRLDLTTSEPALVVYAAGYLDKIGLPNTKSREMTAAADHHHYHQRQPKKHVTIRAEMDKFAGISLEPIRYPDAIHHRDWANMVILHRDQVYRQKSIYRFSVVPQTTGDQ
ncbi:galactose mutarotase-like domain-containing protein [Mortierella sp. GBAus27b]|nr:hypothetical protein BGX31_002043 [Mortierella sp. GBA43]KAI8362131.1 galactose mutarotase-like domain-containing protein [Mortierella sp. GBAus27b]